MRYLCSAFPTLRSWFVVPRLRATPPVPHLSLMTHLPYIDLGPTTAYYLVGGTFTILISHICYAVHDCDIRCVHMIVTAYLLLIPVTLLRYTPCCYGTLPVLLEAISGRCCYIHVTLSHPPRIPVVTIPHRCWYSHLFNSHYRLWLL